MYKSKNLDHLGLVAGMCDHLDLVNQIDALLPSESSDRKVSTGTCVKALIINGLGFVESPLYLVPTFFSDKPTEHLLGEGIKDEMLNDDRLGRCLDDLYEFGLSELFSILAARSAEILGLSKEPQFYHNDGTSFHVHGKYNSESYQEEETCIQICQGYSRDHRPDLNQVCMNLITENSSGIPLFMEGLSGNSSDKKTLAESITKFTSSLQSAPNPACWVADSALYSAENIQNLSHSGLWLTRVPESIREVKELKKLISRHDMKNFTETKLADYRYKSIGSTYGGVKQEWVLVFSQKAYQRESKSFFKRFLKGSEAENKALQKLCRKRFACEQDAENEFKNFKEKCKYITLNEWQIERVEGYAKKGKPDKNAKKLLKGFHLKATSTCKIEHYEKKKEELGFFVLASNDIEKKLSPEQKLMGYKGQDKVEKGFRFLKDPAFLASNMFVKKPERVEAILMIMTLCLLVYASLERELRKALEDCNETLPNQSKKEVKNPTMKWVFILFRGIHLLYLEDKNILLNINEIHLKIIRLLTHEIDYYYKIE